MASTSDLNRLMPGPNTLSNSLWDPTGSTWLTDIGGMIVLSVVVVVIAWWRLNRLSPGRRK